VKLAVLDRGGVPATAVAAVVLNVTVTQPQAAGYLEAFADGVSRPQTSNLNFVPGQTVANTVIVPVGGDGKVDIVNISPGATQLIADVEGWFASGSPGGGGLTPLTAARILDTRTGTGGSFGPVQPGGTVTLAVFNQGGVPSTGLAAVALNVTVTQPQTAGYLTAYDGVASRLQTSNVNFVAGETIANTVVAPVATNGTIKIDNISGGTVQIIAT
jgi:hypothetical protein